MLVLVLVPLLTGGLTSEVVFVVVALGGGGMLWAYAQALGGRWLLKDVGTLWSATQVGFLGAIAMASGAVVVFEGGLNTGVNVLLLALVTGTVEVALVRSARPEMPRERPAQEESRTEDRQMDAYELAARVSLHVVAVGLAGLGVAAGLAMVWALVPALLAIEEGWNLLTVYGSAVGLACVVAWTVPHIVVLLWLGTWGPRVKATLVAGAVVVLGALVIFPDPPIELEVAMALVGAGVVAEVLLVMEISRRRARGTA